MSGAARWRISHESARADEVENAPRGGKAVGPDDKIL